MKIVSPIKTAKYCKKLLSLMHMGRNPALPFDFFGSFQVWQDLFLKYSLSLLFQGLFDFLIKVEVHLACPAWQFSHPAGLLVFHNHFVADSVFH
jgi:hypothetical protein